MEALTTVFETIKGVIEIIKKFFEDIMGMVKTEKDENADA